MVRADELFDVSIELATELRGAMRTAVFEYIDRTVVGANDHDGRWADVRTDEVAGLRYFAFQSDVIPGATMENLLDLALVDCLIGVDPIGDARESFSGPDVMLRQRKLKVRVHGGDLPSVGTVVFFASQNATVRLTIRRPVRHD